MGDSFGSLSPLRVGGRTLWMHRLPVVEQVYPSARRLPFCLKVVLENLLRREDGQTVTRRDIEAVACWQPQAEPSHEIAFMPARVLMQDFTGVPALVDLAAMRDAMKELGGDPARINPLVPAELVIDHSVQVDEYGRPEAFAINAERDYERNRERYVFLRWGQQALRNLQVVPPATGIVHQVNLEYLARVVMTSPGADGELAYFDTVIGTDSHTTMINGLGVLGWGVGGIEAEAAMLGQPMSMLVPQVVGVRLVGCLREGATATDLVLTVTELLRKKGVVGKFVEFFGEGVASLPVADRATLANMAPEYGATCGIFPIDAETLRYLRFTGRPQELVDLVEAYAREQGLLADGGTEAVYSDIVELDLGTVEACVAGPSRPQDRVPLGRAAESFREALPRLQATAKPRKASPASISLPTAAGSAAVATESAIAPAEASPPADGTLRLQHGSVVIAAITSCTNTSNPSVMLAAGLLAKKAVERGLRSKPWVKTSLAPGSKVVTDYLRAAGLLPALEQLRFHLVGYGCTTCIGNSGPLPEAVSQAIEADQLVVAAVLSGNRNFEGRVHPEVRANYLMSPPLVVAYALAGRVDLDLLTEPLGQDAAGRPVYLRELWPTQQEIAECMSRAVQSEMFRRQYAEVFAGDARWQSLPVPQGELFAWDPASTYVKRPPYFEGMSLEPPPLADIRGARVLAVLGDSITTDHISPAGSIRANSPAGQYLIAQGVSPQDFNSYGARRGNHEVMVRGTFANVRLKNRLVPGVEGGFTRHFPEGTTMTIFEAAERYRAEQVPLLVLAGKEYGSGSSRDWAAKGPRLLGVRAVLAESYERIHRSNLVGMGVLPVEFCPPDNVDKLGLTGEELYDIEGITADNLSRDKLVQVTARAGDGRVVRFSARARLDTPQELEYYRHGGILPYVLRQLLRQKR